MEGLWVIVSEYIRISGISEPWLVFRLIAFACGISLLLSFPFELNSGWHFGISCNIKFGFTFSQSFAGPFLNDALPSISFCLSIISTLP